MSYGTHFKSKHLLRGCPNRPSSKENAVQETRQARDTAADIALQYRLLDIDSGVSCTLLMTMRIWRWNLWDCEDMATLRVLLMQASSKSFAHATHNRHVFFYVNHKLHADRWWHGSSIASWSSAGCKSQSACQTNEKSESHVTAAAKTTVVLTAVTASGLILDFSELNGARFDVSEVLFRGEVGFRLDDIKVVVHDDACHLRLVAESLQQDGGIAQTLGTSFAYIIDDFHSSGHVGSSSKEHCLLGLWEHRRVLDGFPTGMCETVNSCPPPLSLTMNRMDRWMCQCVTAGCRRSQLGGKGFKSSSEACRETSPPRFEKG